MSAIIKVSPVADCKRRVAAIKASLPKNVKQLIIDQYPEYNSVKGSKLIDNVKDGRSADLKLTEIMEAIAKKGGKNGK